MAMAAAGAKLRRLMGIVWWALRLLMMAQALAAAVGWLARAEMQGAAPARTPLGEALVARDAEAVRALIDAGVGLSEPTEVLAGRSGVVWCTGSALYTAARLGDGAAVRALLAAGAAVEVGYMCASGALDAKSALHAAAEGRSKGHADAVEALLEAGAAPEEGRSALLGALTVSPLFEAVGELAEGPEGATDGAAIAAARRKNARLDERASLRAVEALLASGARPAVGVRAGWGWLLSVAPLSHAVAAKRDGATKVLLSAGADPEGGLAVPADSPDATSSSSSDFFATESEFQRMGMFGAPHGGGWLYHVTPLEAAAQAGAAACATLLLHAGADAKHGTLMFHYTPLKVGLGTPLFTAASNGHTDVGRVLLANGATMDEVPGMQYGVPPEGSVRYGSASPGGPGGSSAATAPPKAKRSKTTKKKKKATKAKTPAVEL